MPEGGLAESWILEDVARFFHGDHIGLMTLEEGGELLAVDEHVEVLHARALRWRCFCAISATSAAAREFQQ